MWCHPTQIMALTGDASGGGCGVCSRTAFSLFSSHANPFPCARAHVVSTPTARVFLCLQYGPALLGAAAEVLACAHAMGQRRLAICPWPTKKDGHMSSAQDTDIAPDELRA